MNKRGQSKDLMFSIFGLIIVAIIILIISGYVNDVINNSDYKKRYDSLDTGLIINTIYSSPNNIIVSYDLKDKYMFTINSNPYSVLVKSKDTDLGKTYSLIHESFFKFNNKKTNSQIISIEKNQTEINIYENSGGFN